MGSNASKICCSIVVICIFGIIIVGILVGLGWKRFQDRTKPVTCPETKETFHVQNNKDEAEWVSIEIARRLGKLTTNGDILVGYMEKNNLPNAQIAQRLAQRWKKIRKNPRGVRETSSNEQPAAYTVNKSEQLRICIRSPDSPDKLEDLNTSMLVLLHELAHIMSRSYGHFNEFKTNFATITNIAVELGLYKYVDYSKNPTVYCKTKITHSPYVV